MVDDRRRCRRPGRISTKDTRNTKGTKKTSGKRPEVRLFVSIVCFVVALLPARASAQIYETFGIRAQGMGGAFVALADDATASWWNPAGLASGALLNSSIESIHGDPSEMRARAIAIAIPSFGLSYYRLPLSGIRPTGSTVPSPPGRQDLGDLSQFGVTVGQSIGDHFVLASTLKIVNGQGDTLGDLDIGAMVRAGHARLGVNVKNVTKPTFGSGDDAVDLTRQVRVGAALTSDTKGPSLVSLTVDADLTTSGTVAGDERHLAAGAEVWHTNRRIGIRGGMAFNTVGDARYSASAGVSLGFRKGAFFEAQTTGGKDYARRGWSFGLRVTR
jgi:hypothetical protein